MKREDLRSRDPYILAKDGKYYLYKAKTARENTRETNNNIDDDQK